MRAYNQNSRLQITQRGGTKLISKQSLNLHKIWNFRSLETRLPT